MQKNTINKIAHFILAEDIKSLSKMKLVQKSEIEKWIAEFYKYAIENKKFESAKYLFKVMLQLNEVADNYKELYGYYSSDKEKFSYLKESLMFYAITNEEDYSIIDFAKELIDSPEDLKLFISKMKDFYNVKNNNSSFYRTVYEIAQEFIYHTEFTEEQCVKGLDIVLSHVKNINGTYDFFGEDNDIFTDTITQRHDCKDILEILLKYGYKLPIDTDGYSPLSKRVIENKNVEAIEFLAKHGADFTVPKNNFVFSAYDIGQLENFWEDNQELAKLILKDKPLDYKSESIKAHEAFEKEDFKAYIQHIKNGAVLIDPYIKADSSDISTGALLKSIDLSSDRPEYFNTAKEILNEAERRGENKTEILVGFSSHNPITFSKCIDLGLDPNTKDEEGTPCVFLACRPFLGHNLIQSVIEELVNKGCDITYVDEKGESLLDKTIEAYRCCDDDRTNFELIDYLYSKGCSFNKKTLIGAIKYPLSMDFFNKINEYFDWSDMPQEDFDNLIPHYERMIEYDQKSSQNDRLRLEDYLKRDDINQDYVDNQKELIRRKEDYIKLYGQLIEKIKNMDICPCPTM